MPKGAQRTQANFVVLPATTAYFVATFLHFDGYCTDKDVKRGNYTRSDRDRWLYTKHVYVRRRNTWLSTGLAQQMLVQAEQGPPGKRPFL